MAFVLCDTHRLKMLAVDQKVIAGGQYILVCYTHAMSDAKVNFLTVLWGVLRKYERHISAIACVVGFTLDSLLLPSIDHVFTRFVSIAYFGIVGALLLFSQAVLSGKLRIELAKRMVPLLSVVVQFLFGALLSVVFVYYFRSSAFAVSWPLLILLGLLFAGNEIWKKQLERLEFQLTVLFILFLFFSIFTVPLLFGAIGTGIFVLSVTFSVIVMGVYIMLLTTVAFAELKQRAVRLFLLLSVSALLVVGLYVLDILPPIPLVTRADGVYHALSKDAQGGYLATAEQLSWKERYFPLFYPVEYHRSLDEPVYFYSAVYVPTVLHTPIVHDWQYWSKEQGWQSVSRISFSVSGGRAEGYRGYSEKRSVSAGLWRVVVETEDGRTLSRRTFMVVDVASPADTTTVAL